MSQLPCIVCGTELAPATNFDHNQPYKGTVFHTQGNYGSTVFDPMDGARLEVNICDTCLTQRASTGAILYYPGVTKRRAKTWDGKE